MLFWYYEECISSYPSDVQVESQGDKGQHMLSGKTGKHGDQRARDIVVELLLSAPVAVARELRYTNCVFGIAFGISAPKCTVMLVRMQLWMFEAKDTNIDIIV
ncbi:hypothetical protein JRO89_XS10G0085800 [Xanthoceras sorbifolium]|uniref:Uncharacterized protein n=1 Tax=Xanthoceras sorbifolium TaxID=99658 RepID=A0ABQ8HI40_9ROSI|nr:hypothetical protein JRO89_XS10G0085800 [Xanthoceras sorbifolium]